MGRPWSFPRTSSDVTFRVSQLYRQGWAEIPEVMASSVVALVGIGFMGIGSYLYIKYDGDRKRYRYHYTEFVVDEWA
ncbi:uncharacterized protein NdufA3 isoform X2 [Procambarus clarkii]|uniref:uncharacterized protein NdufA3 isoform X2 n=1 Tax=Procambarus clarkii TaxID=6728 RepID=UPI00374334A4